MRPFLTATCAMLAVLVAPVAVATAQGTDAAVSAFRTYGTAAENQPRTGVALTLADGPAFALRASGRMAFHTLTDSLGRPASGPRSWAADVDAVFALGGRPFGPSGRTASTVAFVGFGRGTVADSSGMTVVADNWSYGLGTILPLGSVADLMAETRWRLNRLVLPTANPRPTRMKELRFGLSIHFAHSGRGR